VKVSVNFTQKNFGTRRDWAAINGGADLTTFTGPDFTPFGCAPENALDTSQSAGWVTATGSTAFVPSGTVVPKRLVVRLPQAVDIGTGSGAESAFKIEPTANCGVAGSTSTGDFTIEVAQDAAGPWTTVVNRNGEAEWLPRFQFTQLSASQAVPGVRFVRFTINSPQVPDFGTNCPDGAFDGCTFMALTEMEVFGLPAAP